jgi:hypothetical protein
MYRLLAAVILLIGLTLAGVWVAYDQIGRTPIELIRYTERRLEGHPKLQFVALPILGQMRVWLDEPAYGQKRFSEFTVPKLPPNPASMSENGRPSLPLHASVTTLSSRFSDETAGVGRIIHVGPHRDISTIAAAAKIAGDGDIIEIDAGDYRADVAVWNQARLTIRGIGDQVRLIASGASAEGKAIWVIRKGNITIENIDFIGSRVSDSNGAGIRFEKGHLIVRKCLFYDNQNGLLASGGDASLEIENSEFAYNGEGDGQTHHLYVGDIKSLKVTGSYFHHANVGHLIKSRAAKNYIAYNRLTDESGGRASYELEFPNGGMAYVIGNIIQQSAETDNSTMIAFGAEGYAWPQNELYLINNTLVNDYPQGGAFLRVAPGAQYIRTQNNLLVGTGRFHTPDIRESIDDARAEWDSFALAVRQDYRLNTEGREHTVSPPGIVHGLDLTPRSEYLHPVQLKTLTTSPVYPGAIQTPGP